MKRILFIILFLFETINCINLQPSEFQCIKNVLTKANDRSIINLNISTSCLANGVCNDNGSFIIIFLFQQSSEILKWDDFNCFPSLSILTLYNSTLSNDFLYTKNNNISEINIFWGSNINSIDQEVVKLKTLYISEMKANSTIKASHLKNVNSFKMDTGPIIYQVDGFQSDSVLNSLVITSNLLPNFSLHPSIISFYFYFGSSFNISTLDNFKYLNNTSTLSLTSDNPINITDLFELFSPLNILFRIQIQSNISLFKTVEQINLSKFKNLKHLYLTNTKNFEYNGLFPFSTLPQSLELILRNANFPITDFKLFENITSVDIDNSNITNPLQKIEFNKTYPQISIINSKLTGTLDESWCGKKFIFTNNSLSGKIPDCFYCYLNIPSISSRLVGNNFTNYFTKIDNCGLSQIKIHNITFMNDFISFVLNGENLGITSNMIISPNNITLSSNDIPGRDIYGRIPDSISVTEFQIFFRVPPINFTVSIPPRPPRVTSVLQTNATISIYGKLFSNDLSSCKVMVGVKECTISYSVSNEIRCDIPYPVTIDGKQAIIVTVYNYSSNVYTASIKQTNIQCNPTDCNSNGVCDTFYGVCICSSSWLTINNNICTIAIHNISSTSKVFSDTGGNITLYGFFGSINNNPQLLFNNQSLTIISISNSFIQTSIPPGDGLVKITFIQNNVRWSGTFSPYNVKLLCPNNCGGPNQGSCNILTGECVCENYFIGFDCHPSPNVELPPSTTEIGSTGSTTITNEQTAFKISIQSVVEIDFNGNEIDSSLIKLQGNWTYNKNKSISTFNRTIDSTTTTTTAAAKITFILTIEEVIDNDKLFTFADNTFTVKKGGIKMSLSISNWNYRSNLNTLRVKMLSDIIIDDTKNINTCNDNSESFIESSSNSNDLIGNLNYLKFSYNGKILQGRFQNKMLSDGRPTTTLTNLISKSENQIIIALNLPHCTECLLDPDFSVLVSPNFNSSTSCISNGNNDKAWLIPVAVVVPVVGLTIIIIIIFIIAKKNSTTIKIIVKGIGMKKMP
ncbi:hypothetical protein RB653_004732 [Dictyostelium firmibasis]|uniref:EGF-like domain-containing protein n=1 Tax=Dictyostelium firmibasis TaxID=79012 RepID=A0AAN7U1H8_9MYCE